jgi:hypothetical protein
VNEAGEHGVDATHLQDEVDNLADRLDDLQAKLDDRCSELQSAATAVTQFNVSTTSGCMIIICEIDLWQTRFCCKWCWLFSCFFFLFFLHFSPYSKSGTFITTCIPFFPICDSLLGIMI